MIKLNHGEAVVQWLAFGHMNLGSRVQVPISDGHFFLVLLPSGRVPNYCYKWDLQCYMHLRL